MDPNAAGTSRDSDRIYATLRQRILCLELEPGAVLDESRIVQEIGTSRTPIREAVIRLVSEGLLRRDGRQIVVSSFQVGQLRAFFEALTLLARATHRMAAERRSKTELEDIRMAQQAFETELRNGNVAAMNEANNVFHCTIAHAADNPFLSAAYDTIMTQSLRLSRQCFVVGEDPENRRRAHLDSIVADHAALVSAIAERDVAEADRVAAVHIQLFKTWLGDHLLGPSTHDVEMALDT